MLLDDSTVTSDTYVLFPLFDSSRAREDLRALDGAESEE